MHKDAPEKKQGISVIILTRDAPELLDRLLKSLVSITLPFALEIIILDKSSGGCFSSAVLETIKKYAALCFIRHIRLPSSLPSENLSFSSGDPALKSKARYAKLLTIDNSQPYSDQEIMQALDSLASSENLQSSINLGRPFLEKNDLGPKKNSPGSGPPCNTDTAPGQVQVDESWYFREYPDVARSGMGALEH